MYPPGDVCRRLWRLHRGVRLAWFGREPAFEGEENPGEFMLVQLYHRMDCGTIDEPLGFRQFWDADPTMGEHGNFVMVKSNRPQPFNKFGGSTRDWNSNTHYPIMLKSYTKEEVFSGRVIPDLAAMCEANIKERLLKQRKEAYNEFRRRLDDIEYAAGEDYWQMCLDPSSESVNMTNDESRAHVDAMYKKSARNKEALKKSFIDPWLEK